MPGNTAGPRQDFDHWDPSIAADPYPVFSEMRATCPVAHTFAHGGYWALTAYEDIWNVVRDTSVFSSEAQGITIPRAGSDETPMMIPVEIDPPMHGLYRRLLQRELTPKALEALEPVVREITLDLIAQFSGVGSADLVADLVNPLPVLVIAKLVGSGPEEMRRFKSWVTTFAQLGNQDPAVSAQAVLEVFAFFQEQIDDRRAKPRTERDVITVLVESEIEGRALSDGEILQYLLLILTGGSETTASAMGMGLCHLGTHPELRARIIEDPSLIPAAVEESLRIMSPVLGLSRTVLQDTSIHGTEIPKGDRVWLGYAAANRDPMKFPNPDEFILPREGNAHLAFGAGPHRCLGSNLARLEFRIVLEEVLRHIPDYEIDGEIVWHIGTTRCINRLPVRFTPSDPASATEVRT